LFEEYLEDSHHFMLKASSLHSSGEARRYYRVSVFCAMSAIEAFVNYVGDAFAESASLEPYEIAFLTDRQFAPSKGRFEVLETMEYHRLEDKLKFLIQKFLPSFNFERTPCWGRLIGFKKFRDSLTHPRQEEDETGLQEYKTITARGLSSIIEIMNYLCTGIFHKPLRKKLLDLKIS
jgi:hypothetical protein